MGATLSDENIIAAFTTLAKIMSEKDGVNYDVERIYHKETGRVLMSKDETIPCNVKTPRCTKKDTSTSGKHEVSNIKPL